MSLMLCNFIEIALRHGCSPVNLLHIFRTPFPKNTSGWLLRYLSPTFSWEFGTILLEAIPKRKSLSECQIPITRTQMYFQCYCHTKKTSKNGRNSEVCLERS